jgi:hypothetical protein
MTGSCCGICGANIDTDRTYCDNCDMLETTYIQNKNLHCKACQSEEIVEIDTREGVTLVVRTNVNTEEEIDEYVEDNGNSVEYEYKCNNCNVHISASDIGDFHNSEEYLEND